MPRAPATSARSRFRRLKSLVNCRSSFAVDLVSTKGSDIPEIDTVLFRRPNRRARSCFLQQLGAACALPLARAASPVLDFIGQVHRRFRTTFRYRALLRRSRDQLRQADRTGFPSSRPAAASSSIGGLHGAGCFQNFCRESLPSRRPQLLGECRRLEGACSLALLLEGLRLELGSLSGGGVLGRALQREVWGGGRGASG